MSENDYSMQAAFDCWKKLVAAQESITVTQFAAIIRREVDEPLRREINALTDRKEEIAMVLSGDLPDKNTYEKGTIEHGIYELRKQNADIAEELQSATLDIAELRKQNAELLETIKAIRAVNIDEFGQIGDEAIERLIASCPGFVRAEGRDGT